MPANECRRTACLATILALAACASNPVDQVDLMPAPDVYGDGILNPLPERSPFESIPYNGILFATDRSPARDDSEEKYYRNNRGQILRVGVADVRLGEAFIGWDKAREVSMLKSRTDKYPVRIESVDEWGMLESTVPFWADLEMEFGDAIPPDATEKFADAINAQLAQSGSRDVYLYVHGYKVVFENPVLVASELWHFLGYQGAFIAYAWPSTPSKFAYVKDSDTSAGFARNFRLLIESIANNTDVRRIHILGYSNGTRLVTRTLEQFALINRGQPPEAIRERLKIGQVILVGSDLDRGVFGSYVADGLLDVPEHLTIYMSTNDKALGVSQFLTRRQRLGQLWGEGPDAVLDSVRVALVENKDKISFVNVSDAEGASSGNGHGYFRSSPWASSDVLMSLYYGLDPLERGLTEQSDLPIYTFPDDYIDRLWAAIGKVDPEFAANWKQLRGEAN